MRARPNYKDCQDLFDAGGRTIKGEEVNLDPGARRRIDLLKIAQQLLGDYLVTIEREWAGFQQKMQDYRQKRASWGLKLLHFLLANHPQCVVNDVTDTDLKELETEITKPDNNDAFYMGAMTYLHQIPPQHKEGSTEEITKRITELKEATTRLDRLIKAEEGFLEDQPWLGSDSDEEPRPASTDPISA